MRFFSRRLISFMCLQFVRGIFFLYLHCERNCVYNFISTFVYKIKLQTSYANNACNFFLTEIYMYMYISAFNFDSKLRKLKCCLTTSLNCASPVFIHRKKLVHMLFKQFFQEFLLMKLVDEIWKNKILEKLVKETDLMSTSRLAMNSIKRTHICKMNLRLLAIGHADKLSHMHAHSRHGVISIELVSMVTNSIRNRFKIWLTSSSQIAMRYCWVFIFIFNFFLQLYLFRVHGVYQSLFYSFVCFPLIISFHSYSSLPFKLNCRW